MPGKRRPACTRKEHGNCSERRCELFSCNGLHGYIRGNQGWKIELVREVAPREEAIPCFDRPSTGSRIVALFKQGVSFYTADSFEEGGKRWVHAYDANGNHGYIEEVNDNKIQRLDDGYDYTPSKWGPALASGVGGGCLAGLLSSYGDGKLGLAACDLFDLFSWHQRPWSTLPSLRALRLFCRCHRGDTPVRHARHEGASPGVRIAANGRKAGF